MVTRVPTDIFCVAIFAGCVVVLGWILNYARQNGDYAKLFHGYDWEGQLCGEDGRGEYLYYCQGITGALDLTSPICASECPGSGVGSMQVMNCRNGATAGYETKAVLDRYCVPTSGAMVDQVNNQINSSSFYYWTAKLSQLPTAWAALTAASVIAFALGYVYLFALRECAEPLVCICMLILVAIPAVLGAYLIWVTKFQGGFDGVPNVGNDQQNFYVGCGSCGLAAILALCVMCSMKSMKKAVGAIEAATECMFYEPIMLLVPALEIAGKAIVGGGLLAGFLLLVSCGEISSTGGNGLSRTVTFTNEQYGYLAFYSLMILWALEFFTSLSQFAVAYAAQAWYFTPYDGDSKKGAPKFGVLTGYFYGFVFHLGSLLFGAIIIACFRLVRMLLGALVEHSKTSGNVVLECIAKILACVVDCFTRIVRFVNKAAYIEMAINGTGFCASAVTAVKALADEAGAISILSGATFVLQLAGVGAIGGGGGFLTYLMCLNIPAFNTATSEHYVSDPTFVAGAGAVICSIIAVAFMVVFDTVADTMLLCYQKDSSSSSKTAGPKDAAKGGTERSSFLACCSTTKKPGGGPAATPNYTPKPLKELVASHS